MLTKSCLIENTVCFRKTSWLMLKRGIIVVYYNIHKNIKMECSGKMLRFRLFPRANSDYSYVVSVSLCAWKHSAPTGRIFVKLDKGKVKVTSVLDGVAGQRNAPSVLPPGKTRYPLYRRLGGLQDRSGQVRKTSPPRYLIPGPSNS